MAETSWKSDTSFSVDYLKKRLLTLYSWEGNRRFGTALAMRTHSVSFSTAGSRPATVDEHLPRIGVNLARILGNAGRGSRRLSIASKE